MQTWRAACGALRIALVSVALPTPEPVSASGPEPTPTPPSCWSLYLIRRADGALYTGITTDVERRLDEHANSKRGSRVLRSRGPLHLVYHTTIGNRALASRAEHRVKALDRPCKETLVREQPDSQTLLAQLGLAQSPASSL
jgi:putative endonuclease